MKICPSRAPTAVNVKKIQFLNFCKKQYIEPRLRFFVIYPNYSPIPHSANF